MMAARSRWPDRLVDEALDRTALKIQAGEHIKNIDAFVYAVCRNLLREEWTAPEARTESLTDVGDLPQTQPEDPVDPWLRECLDQCLAALPSEDRRLMFDFYKGQRSAKIEHRKGLSERLGITAGALRQRAFRVRWRLHACIEACLGTSTLNGSV